MELKDAYNEIALKNDTIHQLRMQVIELEDMVEEINTINEYADKE